MAKKKVKKPQKPQKKFSEKEYLRTKMRSLPIGKCYIGPDDPEASEVTAFVTREHPAGTVSVGMYLIDKYCCGVKDAIYKFSISRDEFKELIDGYNERIGCREVPYVEAHNLVYGAKAYAEEIGIPPHPDFNDAQYLLAEDDEEIPLIEYEFGLKGRPTLMCRSMVEIDYYKKLMLKKIGPDDFDTILLGEISGPQEEEDEDGGLDDEPIYLDGIEPQAVCRTEEIKSLDNERKVAYFLLMLFAAKFIKDQPDTIKAFTTVVQKAIETYLKYGDIAFGEASEALYEGVKSASDILALPDYASRGNEEIGALFNFCVGYSCLIDRVNLEQKDHLKRLIADYGKDETGLETILYTAMEETLFCLPKAAEAMKNPSTEVDLPFDVFGLISISEICGKKSVKSTVRIPKYGFISKNPESYYRRKVIDVIDTCFRSAEDFMGLVIGFNNLAFSSIEMIRQRHVEAAYYLLTSIVLETLYDINLSRFDKWIETDSSVRASLSAMLVNTVTILSILMRYPYAKPDDSRDIAFELKRLQYVVDHKYPGFIDLHPLIYTFS